MAASTRIRVLNLGMQNVALAEFSTTPNGALTLHQLQFSELLADPGADASRAGQLEVAIGQLKSASKLKGGVVNYALPSQAVFTRYLSLPGTSASDVNEIIGFEAQQNIPFPIDEVVWDYQPIGQPVDAKVNIILVAIKTDQLESVNRAVEANGFTPKTIDVAPLALLNAFRYNYGDLDGCSLVVDIGARTTNLIFVEGDKAYTRSIPVGGNSITTALAKEFGQTVELAELAKIEKGFVGLGGSYADPDDETVAKISKVSRTTLTRLHAEIARSISFYRANQHGTQPLRVILAGGAVSMPYMLEFFSEKLQMPIEFFNPFRNVTVASTVDANLVGTRAHAVGELVGLALREVGNCPIEINLRPPSVVAAQTLARRKPFLVAATACLFLALLQWMIFFNKAADAKAAVLEGVQRDIGQLEGKAAEFDRLARSQKELEALAAPVLNAAVERSIWLAIIDELGAKLPKDFIWITKLTPLSGGQPVPVLAAAGAQPARPAPTPPPPPTAGNRRQGAPANEPAPAGPRIDAIELQGLYFDNPAQARVIDDFVDQLQTSPYFNIAPADKAKIVTRRNQPDGESWAYGYTIVLPLKNPIALP